MKSRDICILIQRYKIQETLYIGQWRLSPLQSGHLGTSHSSPDCHQPPSYFSESHWWSKISSLSNVILVWGKARSHRAPNLGCRETESPGWFDVSPKSQHKMWCRDRCVVVMKLPIASAHSCCLLNHLNSSRGGMLIWCRFVALLTQLFWMWWPHTTHAHSTASIAPTD